MERSTLNKTLVALEIISGAVVVGLMIADAIQPAKRKTRTSTSPKTKPASSIESQMVSAGMAMLGRQRNPGECLEDFMQNRYNGLYLLGRANHRLTDAELDSTARELAHFHQQFYDLHGHDANRALVEWYSTSGQSRRIPLRTLLSACKEVDDSLNAPAYIAFCLTGSLPPGFKTDIDDSEWEVIKQHLSLG